MLSTTCVSPLKKRTPSITARIRLKYLYREKQAVDANQSIFLEVVNPGFHKTKGYLTVVSKNALTGAPIVIGPLELDRNAWLALTEHCLNVAELLLEREEDYVYLGDEIY